MAKKAIATDKSKSKKEKAEKAPKVEKVKEEKAAAAPKEPKPVPPKRFNSPMNDEERELFLGKNGYLPKVRAAQEALGTANANLRNLYKQAKGHGFEKADFDIAAELETAEKEAKLRAKICRTGTIARYLNSDLGAQIEMAFGEPMRIPAADRALEEGKLDAIKHMAARPSYDPSTEQHRKYMEGYHAEQERQVKAGIAKTDAPEPEKAKPAAKEQGPRVVAAAPAPAPEPASGMKMTRADYEREKELAKQVVAAKKDQPAPSPTPSTDIDDDDGPSMFKKKEMA